MRAFTKVSWTEVLVILAIAALVVGLVLSEQPKRERVDYRTEKQKVPGGWIYIVDGRPVFVPEGKE